MLKIRQSYHGTGGKEGYKFEVYNEEYDYLGELEGFSVNYDIGDTFNIAGRLYRITDYYDSDLPYEEVDEVVYYILKEIKGESLKWKS